MDCIFRQATIADVERLALVGGATFLETFAGVLDGDAIVAHCRQQHSAEAYRGYLEAGAEAWLAETASGSSPIGFSLLASATLPGSALDGSDIELKRIYTLSRFHGSGVGSKLMAQAFESARRNAARRLLLGVYAENARALAFYAKNGFVQVGNRLFSVGGREYRDAVLARPLD